MPKKVEPIRTVASRNPESLRRSPRWMAESARTMVTDEQIRMKVLAAVRLMLSGLTRWSYGLGHWKSFSFAMLATLASSVPGGKSWLYDPNGLPALRTM